MPKPLTHIISGDLWGGAESQMLMQISEQQKEIKNVEVLLFNNLETAKRYKKESINYLICDENKGFRSLANECIKNFNSDSIIVTHGYKELFIGALLKFKFKKTLIATVHGLNEPSKGWLSKLKSTAYRFLNYLLLRFYVDKVICVSNSIKEYYGFKHCSVIWNCVDFTSSSKTTSRKENSILMVGRLAPIKRYDLAIKAIAELKKKNINLKLQIAGTGPLENDLKELISSLNLENNVELLGFRNDIASLLSESSIYLICSDLEGVPTALLEALALKTPSIATGVGGIPEILEPLPDDACLQIEPGRVSLLSKAIEKRLKKLEISNQVPRIVKDKFSKKRAVKDFKEILSEFKWQ